MKPDRRANALLRTTSPITLPRTKIPLRLPLIAKPLCLKKTTFIKMKRFSERIGATLPDSTLQVDSMGATLRNSLWNALHDLYDDSDNSYWCKVAGNVAKNFRKVPVDELPYNTYDCMRWLKEYFLELNWYEAYNFIEFIVDNHQRVTRIHYKHSYSHTDHPVAEEELRTYLNYLLERELSGYRFISGVLSPNSDKVEQDAISDAIQAAQETSLQGAREHLKSALRLLGKKPDPDYRNSIKESISAVESVAKQISGSSAQGLGGAIDELGKATNLHGALKSGFKSLYGFTSDEGGIRHAILDQPNVGFAEAKYMLVSCSAFVNYLIHRADDAGLLTNS